MDSEQLIKKLSTELCDKTSYSPNSKTIQPFWERLKGVETTNLIVYNFLNHQGTYLENFLLSIFPLWKDFEMSHWKEVFRQIEGDELAEYYMKVASERFLGVDPGFKSTKELSINAITFPDEQFHNASNFVPAMTGRLKEVYEKILRDNYGLTLTDLIDVNKRLTHLS